MAKPSQDTRFDVPVFGLKTLEVMKKSGIGMAALQAGSVLLLDRKEVERNAKKWASQS